MLTDIVIWLTNFAVQVITWMGYTGVFILMFVESCGIPVPSEVTMPFAGFLVASGKMSFWIAVMVGAVANLAGSLLAYWIGYVGGRPLITKYGKYFLISHHDLDVADRWFLRHGELIVFVGRLLPVIRTYISFPAGIAKMNVKKFVIYTFAGVLPWSALFAWLGLQMGVNWELIKAKLHNFDVAIAAIIIAGIIFYIWRKIAHAKK